ncbi:MAG TPA: NADH-quinone oxidoreductase subunit NuoE [Afifellaceae bacterium]|nr:NADH-quinone oxidoreductase subunit NuoE [Afifellaceae bacterium]
MPPRRLAQDQPDRFGFTADNAAWARETIKKYPRGRQASAVIPLLWRGQEQEGWVTRPMIEKVAAMLSMPTIRVLEIATFYTMFHLAPVGAKAHVQVCGTTPCMLRGSDDLIAVCKRRIAEHPHEVSADGGFSWEEVECLGACVNAPMVQIFADTYEDLTAQSFEKILDAFEKGETPTPGPQIKRTTAAPVTGLTSLTGEVDKAKGPPKPSRAAQPARAATKVPPDTPKAADENVAKPDASDTPEAAAARSRPSDAASQQPRREPSFAGADDLKRISGVGPKLEKMLNGLGITTFEQIAGWSAADVARVDGQLTIKGRIERDDWVSQAKRLAKGGRG